MAGTASEESGVGRSFEEISSVQQGCQSGEALVEWQSSEQLENGTPSTSPPYWDTDDDDDCGMLFVRINLLHSVFLCYLLVLVRC
ncbi:hypothetical protein CsSME_00020701 [Camellia sinensis var. sinensis]